ncbi:MFS transporter [Clostridium manihotivorum]|uniref:MFS transporter n=1 Tax=Clostridium manihotivorum TaxID=2320868 RepID=A0A410DR63_9CLOT|nr:MFS transporter [Clostridium manihotivorum]QAA31536.1 MFS transporter [Clostridium manihotivorum]
MSKRGRISLGALSHKDFRYFFIGSIVSLIGTWMQNAGQSWLVVTLTDSALKLSFVSALQFTPVLLFSLFAGALIDNYPKKKILLITQSIMGVLAFVLTFLVFTHSIQYWHILVLATILGCCNAVDMPARQSFMIELVGKENLMNAIALNSTVFNAARMVGPAVAGIMIKVFGFFICFLLNAVSFIPLVYGIYKISAQGISKKDTDNKNMLLDVKEGVKYVFKSKEILFTILLVFFVSTFAMNYSVLIPLLAKQVLNMDSDGYGYLMSAMGLGSMLSALVVATRSRGPKRSLMFLAGAVISIMLVFTGAFKSYGVSMICLFIAGIFNVLFSTNANSTIQLKSKDEFRGRVMSVYAMVFAGATPLGSLFEGVISKWLGITDAFIISGVVTIIIGIILYVMMNKRSSNLKSVA